MIEFMNRFGLLIISIITLFFLNQTPVLAQLSAPGASGFDETSYPTFATADSIYIFCAADSLFTIGQLRAETALTGTKTFFWEKYNPLSAAFEFYLSESVDGSSSEITGLADGCYRVTITQGATTEIYRAWVFNNWYTADGAVTESNCDWFKMEGTYKTANLEYYDLADNSELQVSKDIKMEWKLRDQVISSSQTTQIFNPPTQNTDYTFRVFDQYTCDGVATVTYTSIVTKAIFSANPMSGEGPLEVTFTNMSENGDPNEYEWFFFYDLDYLKENLGGSTNPDDSIMLIAYDQNPVYIYENSGSYMVKLVSKKITGNNVCADTAYLDDYIVVDTSFVVVPNVFTPNGDGVNDLFLVKFWSMKSIRISIFNRWGQRIHFWQSGDVQGFEGTYTQTVWDGRLMGGRFASPGVYYYSVDGVGRDGKRRQKHGFFHLFRGKS